LSKDEDGTAIGASAMISGLVTILCGLSLNPWSLAHLISPDRYFESTLYVAAIVACQLVLIAYGIRILWKPRSPRRRFVPLFGAAGLIVGLYGCWLAISPRAWQVPGMPMVDRLEVIAETTTFYKLEAKRRLWRNELRVWVDALLDRSGLGDGTRSLDHGLEEARFLLLEGDTRQAIEVLEALRVEALSTDAPERILRNVTESLAIAFLRLGEQENCIDRHHKSACYLPIPAAGIHTIEFGSRNAIEELEATLATTPDDLGSRWLLNIAYMTLGEHPDRVPPGWLIEDQAFRSSTDVARFEDAAPALGVDILSLSGGSILEDFDGDGFLDIMASGTGLREQLRLFRSSGEGRFIDQTDAAKLTGQFGGLNILQADYNNDGNVDVLVLRGGWMTFDSGDGNHPNSLLRNNGDGTFTDVTEASGLLSFHPTQVGAWADYDNDGWVDLFIGNESWQNQMHPPELFHNNGNGTFTEVALRAGVATPGYIKGAVWGDYDNDGRVDLYVSRIGRPNILYRNEGDASGEWTFEDTTESAGVAEPRYSFPAWFWDYDNDGWEDLFVAGFGGDFPAGGLYGDESVDRYVLTDVAGEYLGLPVEYAESPRLYRNNRDGTFDDVTEAAGLSRAFYVMGGNFGDIDSDGYLDIYLGTGSASYRSLMPNRLFRSQAGARFEDVTASAGVGHLQKGHGIAFGDVDNDGDEDIYAEMGGWFAGDAYQNVLFENPMLGHHWITLRLAGVESNRAAVGARIRIDVRRGDSVRSLHRTVGSGGSFGASSLQQEIGLGDATGIDAIEVWWPSTNERQSFHQVAMDRIYTLTEGEGELRVESSPSVKLGAEAEDNNVVTPDHPAHGPRQ